VLVLRRRERQWVTITHPSGDAIRVGVARPRNDGSVDLLFDDSARTFRVQRDERGRRGDAPDAPAPGHPA
jgi:hypothetical protein